ncbi:uncharacterized protein LOC131159899 isoform X2 [Malania oleifera]|uniref:uncharacterized protein LOC131159899 isoform X2 n=1 Tax=Malania oleifera TaxID=397392 RepID=UPI0025AE0ACC|nr:uncharacterized protein LOC131159899 isoform X2 [Malania oleifera]XP_057971104.1 uncharacterized protein LOC131159899 isoform X2 [Malania oleifera]
MADPTSSQAPFSPLAEAQMTIDGSEQDKALSNSEFLTRREVLTRRSRRVKQLLRIYKILYWLLMEELRARYKEYYWEYGKSAFKEDENKNGSFNANCTDIMEVNGENGKLGSGPDEGVRKCAVAGCKTKAMALARFCHSHILSDSKQKLYKGCSYVVKRT